MANPKKRAKIDQIHWLPVAFSALILLALIILAFRPLAIYREKKAAFDYLNSIERTVVEKLSQDIMTVSSSSSPCWLPVVRVEENGSRLILSGMTQDFVATLLTAANPEDGGLHLSNVRRLNNGNNLRICYQNGSDFVSVLKSYRPDERKSAGRASFVNRLYGHGKLSTSYPVGTVVSSFREVSYGLNAQGLYRQELDGAQQNIAKEVQSFFVRERPGDPGKIEITMTLFDNVSETTQTRVFDWQPWQQGSAMSQVEAEAFFGTSN